MNRPTAAARNAAAVVTVDYDQNQLRRDLNSLRRNVHELCTRSATTGFDCNRFLDSTDRRFIDSSDRAAAVVVKTAGQNNQNLICDKV